MDRTLFQALENYQAMVKAGVNTGMGTDSGPNGRFPGFNAHEEMQLEVMAGRTPMDAIKSATSDNARWLGDKTIGTHRDTANGPTWWCWRRIRWTISATPR